MPCLSLRGAAVFRLHCRVMKVVYYSFTTEAVTCTVYSQCVSMTDAAALALRNRIALPDNILCLINTGIINHLLRSDFITTSLAQHMNIA